MSASLAVQKALRARLVATPALVAMVPATAILDRNQRPVPDPSIILGEAHEVDAETDMGRTMVRVFHTVHVWKREPSLEGVAAICAEIRKAVRVGRLVLEDGFHAADARIADMRTLRDPDGETSHGVVTIEVLMQELVA